MIRIFLKTFILLLGYLFYNNHKSKVIFYHDIHSDIKNTNMSTPFDLFVKHISILREEGYEIVDTITKPEKQVQITFDDGFKGIYSHIDFFIENGFFPTIFISPSLIGKDRYLDWNEIREMHSLGFIFQSHSLSHYNLASYSIDDLKKELCESKAQIEIKLGFKITEICFPQGKYSDLVIDQSRREGYKKMYLSIPGNWDGDSDLVKRNICQFATPVQFKLIINGGLYIFYKRYHKLHYIN